MSTFCIALLACMAVAAIAAPKACPAIYFPVCGADGRIYSNKCVMESNDVKEARSWEGCRRANHPLCPFACTDEYRPVCGSDGKIYATECVMHSENCGKMISVRKMSDCQAEQE